MLGSAVLRDELTDFGDKVAGHFHRGLGRILKGSFVFSDCFELRLRFVVRKHILNPFFVPTFWKLILLHRCRITIDYSLDIFVRRVSEFSPWRWVNASSPSTMPDGDTRGQDGTDLPSRDAMYADLGDKQ
jgi:hypothetical protein